MLASFLAAISPSSVTTQLITLTSTISAGEIICPGEEILFICETRGSSTIAWTSDEYIDGRLEFSTGVSLNDTRQGFIDPNTIATFVNSTVEGGTTRVLVSQLRIIVSSISSTPSVTCIHGRDDIPETFAFQVLGMSCCYQFQL